MKIWVDDVRPAPIGYIWVKSVNEAIERIEGSEIRVGMLDYNIYYCSNCGNDELVKTPFCPQCGAMYEDDLK